MDDKLCEAISRLEAWIRNYGAEKAPVFIHDLEVVIAAARPMTATIGITPWTSENLR